MQRKSTFTAAAQERMYMMHVRDLQNVLGQRNVHPKPFSEVVR